MSHAQAMVPARMELAMTLRLIPVPETFAPDPTLWDAVVDAWDVDEFEAITAGLNGIPVPGRLPDGSLVLVIPGKAAVIDAPKETMR